MRYFKLAIAMTCTVAALALFFLGYQHQYQGAGLNPLVAYPLAMLFLAAPFAAESAASKD